ncbi:MAG: hypothetical protein RL684_1848, partial [Pseudomonadota bacterium]
MARPVTVYVCGSCGGESLKWQGQCPHCNEWNTLTRVAGVHAAARAAAGSAAGAGAQPAAAVALGAGASQAERWSTGLPELDRVLGGGLTAGSVGLIGGEPGIGKSTLLLQVAAGMAATRTVVYASGEESTGQIAQRAARLGLSAAALTLVCDNQLESITATALAKHAALLVVDSIQTMQSAAAEAS